MKTVLLAALVAATPVPAVALQVERPPNWLVVPSTMAAKAMRYSVEHHPAATIGTVTGVAVVAAFLMPIFGGFSERAKEQRARDLQRQGR